MPRQIPEPGDSYRSVTDPSGPSELRNVGGQNRHAPFAFASVRQTRKPQPLLSWAESWRRGHYGPRKHANRRVCSTFLRWQCVSRTNTKPPAYPGPARLRVATYAPGRSVTGDEFGQWAPVAGGLTAGQPTCQGAKVLRGGCRPTRSTGSSESSSSSLRVQGLRQGLHEVIASQSSPTNAHWREALQVHMDWVRLEICSFRRAHAPLSKAHGSQAVQMSILCTEFRSLGSPGFAYETPFEFCYSLQLVSDTFIYLFFVSQLCRHTSLSSMSNIPNVKITG